jgi:hypothetical protein
MPKRCVVAGCGNVGDKEKGVSVHIIPYSGDERNEARKRRKKWVDFVKLKRAKWTPTQYSIICSEHFKPDDFSKRFAHIEGQTFVGNNVLKRDEFGICVFPTVMSTAVDAPAPHVSEREKRMVR